MEGRISGRRRLLAGVRPIAPLHLGHYASILSQAAKYESSHDCFMIVADIQALATYRERPAELHSSVRATILDCLAAGLDPARWSFVIQSQIPELSELTVYLQLLVKTGELIENTTIRDEARLRGHGDFETGLGRVSFGFLGYPISQMADVLLFSPSPPETGDELLVPVGREQFSLIDMASQIARRFNDTYGETFIEPTRVSTEFPQLPGLYGDRWMGRDPKATIYLREPIAGASKKVKRMYTDPQRVCAADPGHSTRCPCFVFHSLLDEEAAVATRREACAGAKLGCGECKTDLAATVSRFLEGFQSSRARLEAEKGLVEEVVKRGAGVAREQARQVIGAVREALQLNYPGWEV